MTPPPPWPTIWRARDLPFALAAVALAGSLLLGGASQNHAASLAASELLGLPALALGVLMTVGAREARRSAWPLILVAGAVVIPWLQLIPLPPEVWTKLPGREGVLEVLRAAGLPLAFRPASLTPETTLQSALALIPPAGLFLITPRLGRGARVTLARMVVAVALASIVLGLLQIAGGTDSPLRLHDPTNRDSAVGFFSNRDHLADFLACAIPLAMAALGAPEGASAPWRPGLMASLLAIIPLLILGVAMTGSRAGLVLVVIGLAGGFALSGPTTGGSRLRLGLMATAGLGVLAALAFGRIPALARFAEPGADLRFAAAPTVFTAVRAYWPIGSGVGSFIPVYQTSEPISLVDPTIFNHAHNDFLEAALESGLAAVLILLGFLAWFARRCRAAWRKTSDAGGSALARAGSLVVAMILIHSTVDYPLRTVAMTSLFAFACALLVAAPEKKWSTDDAD